MDAVIAADFHGPLMWATEKSVLMSIQPYSAADTNTGFGFHHVGIPRFNKPLNDPGDT